MKGKNAGFAFGCCTYGYNGEEHNPETGLQYLRARYYEANQGRFISQDTYGGESEKPLSQNRYLYANGDPVNYFDPGGGKATSIKDMQSNTKAIIRPPVIIKPPPEPPKTKQIWKPSVSAANGIYKPSLGVVVNLGNQTGSVLPTIKLNMQVKTLSEVNRPFCSMLTLRASGWPGPFGGIVDEIFHYFRGWYLKDAEWEIAQRDATSVAKAIWYGDLAKQVTIRVFGGDEDGRPSNAFLHALWSALMVYHIGYAFAKEFATAHEDFTEEEFNVSTRDGFTRRDHSMMDLDNNVVGRIIGNDTVKLLNSTDKTASQVLLDILGSKDEVRRMEMKCGIFGGDLIMAIDCANAVSDGRLRAILP